MTVLQHITAHQPTSSWDLTVVPTEVQQWRSRVAEVARRWGASGDVVGTVELGVSELLGNVLKHVGDPRCWLELRMVGASLRLLVKDRSRVLPTVGEPDWVHDCGRGLWLLRELADAIGFEVVADGKRVWICCQVTPDGSGETGR